MVQNTSKTPSKPCCRKGNQASPERCNRSASADLVAQGLRHSPFCPALRAARRACVINRSIPSCSGIPTRRSGSWATFPSHPLGTPSLAKTSRARSSIGRKDLAESTRYTAANAVGKANSSIPQIPEDVAAGKPPEIMTTTIRGRTRKGIRGSKDQLTLSGDGGLGVLST